MELKIYRSGMVCALHMCVRECCVFAMVRMLLLRESFCEYSLVNLRQGASETHTHIYRERERGRGLQSARGITCHGECLSGGELESVLGESAGISP